MKIHIKEKNKGKFTDYCGGKVTQECINRGKHSSNPVTRKRATFADNARHFKHNLGGLIVKNFKKYFIGGTFEPIINTSNILSNLTQLPYNLDYLNNLQEIKKRLKLLKMLDEANRTNLILETVTGLASDYFKTKNSPAISFNAPTSSTFKLSSFWNNPTLLQ